MMASLESILSGKSILISTCWNLFSFKSNETLSLFGTFKKARLIDGHFSASR